MLAAAVQHCPATTEQLLSQVWSALCRVRSCALRGRACAAYAPLRRVYAALEPGTVSVALP